MYLNPYTQYCQANRESRRVWPPPSVQLLLGLCEKFRGGSLKGQETVPLPNVYGVLAVAGPLSLRSNLERTVKRGVPACSIILRAASLFPTHADGLLGKRSAQ